MPTAAIGGLSMALVAGLELLGVLVQINGAIGRMVSRGGSEMFPKALPMFAVWLAAATFAFGTAAAILGTPGQLRRGLLWLSAVFLVFAWAPVLSLASHVPEIAAPLIATLWSGICALIYTSRHDMPADRSVNGNPAP